MTVTEPKGFARSSTQRVPGWLWLGPVVLSPLAVMGPNVALGLYAILVLSTGLRLLWRSGEPPILLVIFLYQWVQSATGAVYGNAIGVPLSQLVYFQGQHEYSTALMLTGTLVLAIAMRLAVGNLVTDLNRQVVAIASSRTLGYWVRIYFLTLIIGTACETLAPLSGGLAVPFLTMSDIKWVGFVLLTIVAFAGRHPGVLPVWAAIFSFEFLLSIGGYFASFKEVFFFTIFGIAASNVRLRPRMIVIGGILLTLGIVWGIVWSAVKVEYRDFANAGTGQQVVVVDLGQRIGELSRLLSVIDAERFSEGADAMIRRLMYHQFFGAVTTMVPQYIPHTNGAIWLEAASRPFMPRSLFPNKRSIDDSDLTNQYTGLQVATAEQGTSISIGYMAEAYIDFGPVFMFAPIAALGFGLGIYYRWLLRQPGPLVVIGAALAPFALLPAQLAETSILKMIPSLILTFLVCLIVLKFLAPVVFGPSVSHRKVRRLY